MNRARTADRLAALRPTAINHVLQEVRRLQAEGKDVVSLMRGQPDTPTPAHIVEAACKALRDGRTGYPDNQGEPDLRAAVAEKLARANGLTYDPGRNILVTDGATGGVAVALGALVRPGDDVLVPEPAYDAYASAIALWGGRAVAVEPTTREDKFRLIHNALESARTPATRLLLLNTPWNPVGTVFTRDELRMVTEFAARHDLFVISDEIYEALVYDGRQHLSPASLSADAQDRTILVNSLSKTYAMTGWRVGYCAGPAEVIRAMLLLLQQYSRGPATFAQDAAACALRSDQGCVERMRSEYQRRRDLVHRWLDDIPGVDFVPAEGGLFVMVSVCGVPVGGMLSDQVRRFLLHECGVAVLHGAVYGSWGEGMLRVSFAAGGAALEQGLERLRGGLMSAGTANARFVDFLKRDAG
jgi:aspartate/methionine/tyrosine aminotransferase